MEAGVAEVTDRRRAIADRNVHAILDAAEELIRVRAPVTIAGVATAAGVSRVAVYAHFATAEALLEAGVGEVRAGRIEPGSAESALVVTIRDLFTRKPVSLRHCEHEFDNGQGVGQ